MVRGRRLFATDVATWSRCRPDPEVLGVEGGGVLDASLGADLHLLGHSALITLMSLIMFN